jgi:hypothetical protein
MNYNINKFVKSELSDGHTTAGYLGIALMGSGHAQRIDIVLSLSEAEA